VGSFDAAVAEVGRVLAVEGSVVPATTHPAALLAETNRVAGAVGWGYAVTLGFALVYLGEHYAIDLVAGAALVALVRRGEPLVEPAALRFSESLQRLERLANG